MSLSWASKAPILDPVGLAEQSSAMGSDFKNVAALNANLVLSL